MFMKKIVQLALLLLVTEASIAQSPFIKRNMDDALLLERLDVLNGRVSDTLLTSIEGMPAKDVVAFLERYLETHAASLSVQDKRDIKKYISQYGEWAADAQGAQASKKPILDVLYQKKPDLFNYSRNGNTFVINPVIHYQQLFETAADTQNMFVNTRGLEARGVLKNRVGFYTIFADNQERGPLHWQHYVATRGQVPGNAFHKTFKPEKAGIARDYLYAAGYIDAEVIKNTLNVSFGQDRFHIGDGYRSLFLSDFGTNYTFLKLNTKLWKFNYQNLFMELVPQFRRRGDNLVPRKYAAMHHLSINATKWLNIGVFESVIFSRKDHFDFSYMNPIIFYRAIEQFNGSPDNALMGLNFKINTRFQTQFYGQVILDEFKFSELKARDGWWANKYGFQLGGKIVDPLGIKHLLLQAEMNIVRPFTYSRDSVTNYTHYNQVMAHPYGANFAELNLIARYKPIDRLYLTGKAFYNRQGRDTLSAVAMGGDIFKDYRSRMNERGYFMFSGYPSSVKFLNFNASYELKDNLFIDLGATYRKEYSTHPHQPSYASMQLYTGFRLNAVRRQYDY